MVDMGRMTGGSKGSILIHTYLGKTRKRLGFGTVALVASQPRWSRDGHQLGDTGGWVQERDLRADEGRLTRGRLVALALAVV